MKKYGYIFMLPFIVGFLVFRLFPLLYTFIISFAEYDAEEFRLLFVGIENYIQLFRDPYLWQAIGNTFRIWIPNIVMQISLAFFVSIILSNIQLRLKLVGLFKAIFYFPNLIMSATIALLFASLLDWQYGTINRLLFNTNVDAYIDWMAAPNRARAIIAIIAAWQWFGNTLLILMAGFSGIPRSLYEAAYIDGASAFQSFVNITLPISKPILIYIAITSFSGGMQMFDLPQVMTEGTGEPQGALMTTIMYMYRNAFGLGRIGYAASISYLLLVILMLFSLLTFKFLKSGNK